MDSVEAAREKMCAQVAGLGCESVALEAGLNRVLAQPIRATRDQPPFRSAAMDGYALRKSDLENGRPLEVVGVSAAGARYLPKLSAGESVRIFTGAPVPDGADCVLPQEDANIDGERLIGAVPRSNHIRERAIDFSAGTTLIESGRRLDSFTLSLAAAAGHAQAIVAKAPRIALLATGSELVLPGREAGADQIYDSVSFGLCALIEAWGGVPVRHIPEADNVEGICRAAAAALPEADLLITIGGASVGDHDLVKSALARLDLTMMVPRVALKPGKPTWFGRTALGPVLGLPGNPVSALVCAHLFLRPLLEKMLGRNPDLSVRTFPARTAGALAANGSFEHYIRAQIEIDPEGCRIARACEQQDSAVLSALLSANALLKRLPGAQASAAGERVEVIPLHRDG